MAPEGLRMTEAERDIIADLKVRIAWLEARLAELDPPRPAKTSTDIYPKRADEK